MRIWDVLAKATTTTQTISDDARSRLARKERAEQTRLTREEYDSDTGERQLWYTIVIPAIAGFTSVPIPWLGTSEKDARASFIEWLAQDEFQTVDFTNDGKDVRFTFRGSWVAGFLMDGKGRRRQ